jgi:hypothetical protein
MAMVLMQTMMQILLRHWQKKATLMCSLLIKEALVDQKAKEVL